MKIWIDTKTFEMFMSWHVLTSAYLDTPSDGKVIHYQYMGEALFQEGKSTIVVTEIPSSFEVVGIL